jgi:hypothetical protein
VGRKASVSINSDGELSVTGELTHDKALCRGLVAFFFYALECILTQEEEREASSSSSTSLDETFLRSILTCCMVCVVQAAGITHKNHLKVKDLPVYSFIQMTESTPMSFLHYAPLFRMYLAYPPNKKSSNFPFRRGLPQRVQRDFLQAEYDILDAILWAKDPNFEDVLPDRVDDLIESNESTCCWWPVKVLIDEKEEGAGDIMYPSTKEDPYYLEIYHNLSVLMERTLAVSHKRMESICRTLAVTEWRLLLKLSWETFRHLLRSHVKLFYDRHIDHWILTTIYGVGRRMKYDPEITFAQIIAAYMHVRIPEIGETNCHRIIRQVKIEKTEGSSVIGHLIVLYNKVFLPAMKSHLLKSKDLQEAAERLAEQASEPSSAPSPLQGVSPNTADRPADRDADGDVVMSMNDE